MPLALAFAAAIQTPVGPALTAALTAQDAAFFHILFDECDPGKLAASLTPDFKIYRDRSGRFVQTAAEYIDSYAKQCLSPGTDASHYRREVVEGSVTTDPIAGTGVIEEGDHLIYERQGNAPEALLGKKHFLLFWKLNDDGVWRLSRAMTYASDAIQKP